MPFRLPTLLATLVVLVWSASVEFCLEPIINPKPPVPISPDSLVCSKCVLLWVFCAAVMLRSLPAVSVVWVSDTTFEPVTFKSLPAFMVTVAPVKLEAMDSVLFKVSCICLLLLEIRSLVWLRWVSSIWVRFCPTVMLMSCPATVCTAPASLLTVAALAFRSFPALSNASPLTCIVLPISVL